MANKLKAITARAKKLYRTGRYKKWTDAIKAASKKIGSTSATRKIKTVAKKNKVRLPHGYKTVKRKRISGTIAGNTSALKSSLENKIATLLIRQQLKATTKRDKRKIGKEISRYKRTYRLL